MRLTQRRGLPTSAWCRQTFALRPASMIVRGDSGMEATMPQHKADPVLTTNWRDEGCPVWSQCLRCPLPRCVFDVSNDPIKGAARIRDAIVARLYDRGVPVATLARRFKVHKRNIYRGLERARGERAA